MPNLRENQISSHHRVRWNPTLREQEYLLKLRKKCLPLTPGVTLAMKFLGKTSSILITAKP